MRDVVLVFVCGVLAGLVALPCANAIIVRGPAAIAGQEMDAVVYSKFFGPQSGYEVNGTAVYYGESECDALKGNFSGKILITEFKNTYGCTFRTRYLNMWRAGVIVAVQSSSFPVPGQTYAMHDGDWGKDTKHKNMVWLQVADTDFTDVMDTVKAGTEVELTITVDPNQWKDLYSSWHFILTVRVILPILFLVTCCYGATLVRQVYKEESNAMRPTKLLVLSIETFCMFICGCFLAVEGMFADSNMPFQAIWFFGTGLFGWSMFTTILVGIFYYSLNKATSTFTLVRNSLDTYRRLIVPTFLICVGMDLAIGSMFATYQDATLTLAIGAVIFTLGNFIAGVFFIYEKNKFRKHVIAQNQKWDSNNRPPVMILMCEHLGRWLRVSTVFMFLFCIGTPMLGFQFAWSLTGFSTLTPLLFFVRWGTGFTQMKALSWNPNDHGGPQKQITRWDKDTSKSIGNSATSSSGAASNSNSSRRWWLPAKRLLPTHSAKGDYLSDNSHTQVTVLDGSMSVPLAPQ